jgi:16S rRNA (guanine527-N7)-methyltransferase
MADDAPLRAALAVIQARGAIGERSLSDAVAHADRFVSLIPAAARSLVDLGSGGGLPALVIAWRRSDLDVTMVERRTSRADLLRRAVTALGLGDRVTVLATDVAAVCALHSHSYDVVTARSFGDPAVTAEFAGGLLADGGIALISEPPVDRTSVWAEVLRDGPELVDEGLEQGIRRLRRTPVST